MSCPTCDHTMNCVGSQSSTNEAAGGIFACPRCGTIVSGMDTWVPKLVERCRFFRAFLAGFGEMTVTAAWFTTGIAESINLPADRRP